MYGQETIKPYKADGDKGAQVEQMFDNIAHSYDKLNHRLSWNIDRGWRRKAIARLIPFSPQHILDIATGTGDFAILAAKTLRPVHLTGTDISEGMMAIAKGKVRAAKLDGMISFQREDCMQLSFPDDTFDAVTVAYGIRNFPDLDKGLSEMCRVLKRGGHLCIAELSHPVSFPMRYLFTVYSRTILPAYGKLISKDKSAYKYLINTIDAFPQAEEMTGILKRAGFASVEFKRLTFGICTIYFATK